MPSIKREKLGVALILIFTLAAVIGLASQDRISQDLAYHAFVDYRTIVAIPNFWNVLSNLPFLIVGLFGVYKLFITKNITIVSEMKTAYFLLFFGVTLVAFGSGYYHIVPSNQTLVWDRLPMTIAFMAMFSIIIAEFISIRIGQRLLWPLLISGVASVIYWHFTELQGVGDLRFYVFIQFFPMLAIPVILICFRSRFSHFKGYWLLISCYSLAKVFEHFDKDIYSFLGFTISGHSIKHMVAALGLYFLLRAYEHRKHVKSEKGKDMDINL
ncbi:hypothetical protein A9Q79_07510 [Methylophaga sp. 42_25_T18]|nr:hypothetical protein A9Q79_07510 [Methylophaga sp. 42_25_T18]